MSSAQNQKVEANCKVIWGDGDFDYDLESEDGQCWYVVKKDHGSFYGPPLTMTGCCDTPEKAWNELDRMLSKWAKQVQSGESMKKDEKLEIFGGPNGRNKNILKVFLREAEKRGIDV
jgi:hypothetical protein